MHSICRQVGSILGATPLVLAAMSLGSPSAAAAILGITGDIVVAPKPTSSAYPNGPDIYAFLEAASVPFPAGTKLDLGSIPTGRSVDSYLFHFDPSANSGTATGSVTFSQPILGFIWGSNRLNASDSIFNAFTPVGSWRGTESNDRNGSTLALGTSELSLTLKAGGAGIDDLRVLTAAAPEPASTIGLLALGLAGASAAVRRRVASKPEE